MASITTKNQPLAELATRIRKLNPSDRETLEMLMDVEFTRAVLRRAGEMERLRKQGRLLSLADMQKSFRA